jgi:hypothetical protein
MRLPNEDELSNLDALHKIASILEEDGAFEEAEFVNDLFLKLSAKKKKKKSGKNVPNNPSLWASCKAWAKRTFDVYPCVPLDSLALTKKGWAEYSDLNIGDEILTYSQSKDKLEWKPVVNLHFYEDAPTLSLKKLQTNFKVRCTPDHKWVLKTANEKYPDNLVEAKNITKRMILKTSAEIVDDVNENLNLSNWRKGDDWVENILKMSKAQLEAFFAAGIVYDGHEKGLSSLNRSTYGFSQKNTNHGEAMEIAAVLLGYRVSFVQKMHNAEMKSWTFIKRDSESTGNLIIEEDLNCDVWCPQTENNTWVMKQGRIITITGNSAYANGAAAKRYKSKGGTWRKADSELNTRLAQVNIVNQSTMYDGQFDTPETETPDTTEDLTDDEVTSLANEIRTLDEEADTELRQHNYSKVSEIISEIETIQNQNPEVAALAKTVLDRLRTFVRVGREKYPVEDTAEPDVIKEMPLKDALEEVKEIIFNKGDYDKAIKFVKDVKLTDGTKDYLSKMLDILIIAKKANPGAKMDMYNDANQLLYLAKQKAQRSDQSANLGFQNIGKTDELIYNYLRKMIQENPINTRYNQNVYKLALELARLKSKI